MVKLEIELMTDWDIIQDDAMFSQGRTFERSSLLTRAGLPTMSEEFFRKALLSRHSPIRAMWLKIDFLDIPYCDHVHFIRHWLAPHWVPMGSTQRPDSLNPPSYDRRKAPQDAPMNLRGRMSVEGLLIIMERRLYKTATTYDQEICNAVKEEMYLSPDEFLNILAKFCQPQCIWAGNRCTEPFNPCGDFPLLEIG